MAHPTATNINISDIGFNLAYASNGVAPIFSQYNGTYKTSGLATYYISEECDTAEICVQKMQSNELTYTTKTTRSAGKTGNDAIPYSNTPLYDDTTDSFLTSLTKISSNETIVEIS